MIPGINYKFFACHLITSKMLNNAIRIKLHYGKYETEFK